MLDGEEFGTSVLVAQPDMVREAQLMDDVETRKHGGCEIVVLRGCRPVVGIGKHGEDDLESVVAEFFERKEESLDALLGSRGYVLVGDDAEAVGCEDKVELRNGMEHGFRCGDDTAVMQKRRTVGISADATHRFGRNKSVGKPLLRLQEVVAYFVEKQLLTGNLFQRVGDILF